MTLAYPVALVSWRGVRVHPALAAALDAACLPPHIRPTGSRSGIRTRADMAKLYPTQPARTSWHEAGLAVDLSPSSVLTDAQVGPVRPAGPWLYGSVSGHLWRPVKGEPWHVQLRSTSWPDSAAGLTCAVAELGPAWAAEAGRPATDWPRAAVTLAQGYLWRLSYLGVRGVDGLWGPATAAALTAALPTWAPVSSVTETILLALAEACAERGV